MKDVLHILYYKIILFLKVDSHFSFLSILKSVGSGIVYLAFAYGCYFLTFHTIDYLLVSVQIGSFLLHRFILVVLFIFFITINVGNIVVSYSTLYKSQEVSYLITKPLSFTKLFLIKFLDNFFYSSTTLLLMITSVLIGYADYFNLSWTFYPIALLFLILPFMFTAGSLGVVILLIILKLSSKFGTRLVLVGISLLYFSGVIAFYFISSPMDLIQNVFNYYPNINQYFGFLENGLIRFLPNYWIADSLYWISEDKFYRAIPYIYANITCSIVLFSIALYLAKKWYYQTWLTSLKITSELRIKNRFSNKFFRFDKKSILNSFDESIVKREFWLFFREPSQWAHFLVMVFLITVFISSVSGINAIVLNEYNEYLKTVIYLVITLFNVFLVASLSLRFVFPLISLEGDSLWKIRSAPINYNQFLLKRLVIYFSIIFFIGQLISFFSNHQFPAQLSTVAQINNAVISISLVSMNFGMGGIFANFKEKNAIRLASSQGASITFLFTLFYLILLIVILFLPVYNFFQLYARGIHSPISNLLATTWILFVLSLLISFISIRVGLRSFQKDI
jgi:ABC-2 type transport system permease protein